MAIKYREFKFYSNADKLEISGMVVAPEGNPIGVVQLLHGMSEYKERYYDFMKFLASHGYLCVIHDHRGHGKSVVSDADLGYFYDAGYEGFVEDAYQVMEMVKPYANGLPYILVAHSMGALVARCFLKKYDDEIDKLILLGNPSKRAGGKLGVCIMNVLAVLKGRRNRSKLADYFMVRSVYDKKFKKEKCANSWLTTDKTVVDAYNGDRYCNFSFTIDGYINLIRLQQAAYSETGWEVKKPELPIKFFSGKDDPCALSPSDFGKSIHFIKDVGYKNVRGAMYKGMRHEVLNEKKKKRVYHDIYDFIKEE